MNSWAAHEGSIRLVIFLILFLLLFVVEKLRPVIASGLGNNRLLSNFSLSFINTLALRLCFPWLAVEFSILMQTHQFGLLNKVTLPAWLNCLSAFLLLDLMLYWQHRLFHVSSWLWRLHRVHHCDRFMDLTTGIRFHPLEAVLSMLIKLAIILVIGAPPLAVLLFEIALSSGALFAHANIKLPPSLDQFIRLFIVTPDMHRLHHSTVEKETNSNYGFFLSCWDRLFNSYIFKPSHSLMNTDIGLNQFKQQEQQKLLALLLNPFKG